jgi:hypothetical protein
VEVGAAEPARAEASGVEAGVEEERAEAVGRKAVRAEPALVGASSLEATSAALACVEAPGIEAPSPEDADAEVVRAEPPLAVASSSEAAAAEPACAGASGV